MLYTDWQKVDTGYQSSVLFNETEPVICIMQLVLAPNKGYEVFIRDKDLKFIKCSGYSYPLILAKRKAMEMSGYFGY
jgi:hypothetical protein